MTSDMPQRLSGAARRAFPRTGRGGQAERILTAARQQAEARRQLILSIPWAAERLCAIMGYQRAEQWTGYVPPSSDPNPNSSGGYASRNTSRYRAALVELCRDVVAYQESGILPEYAR